MRGSCGGERGVDLHAVSEVDDLEFVVLESFAVADENVLGFEVSVDDLFGVDEDEGADDLVDVGPGHVELKQQQQQ